MSMKTARTLLLVKRAQTACRTGLDLILAEFDITPGKYTVLSFLSANEPQSSADLARHIGVSPQSMGELISQLERQALVERFENPEHRRMLMISLTAKGHKLLAECEKRVDDLEACLYEGIGAAEMEAMRKTLQKVAKNSATLGEKLSTKK